MSSKMLAAVQSCSVLVRFALLTRSLGSSVAASAKDSLLISKRSHKPPTGVGCPLCKNGLDRFGYRDVLLLRQFLTPDGYIIGRRKTGICPKMQRRVAKAIRRSRKMGLLPNFKPAVQESEAVHPQ